MDIKKTVSSLVIIVAVFTLMAASCGSGVDVTRYDALAKHLTQTGAKMYGASWCSACNHQMGLFGKSAQYVDSVNCANEDGSQNQVCQDANIRAYPTWEFGDGTRVEGTLTLIELANKSKFYED